MTPVQAVGRHIGRLAARLASRRGTGGLRAEPLAPDDLSRVRALFARDGLAPDAGPGSRRSFSTTRFDPSLSFVVRFEGGLAGALLCRALSRSAIGISAEAIDRTVTMRAPDVHLALIEALLSAATRRGVSELVCTLPAERHS
ncbi:MAG TPA: hypothetical protein VEQ65_06810, partial [Opitutus sp.]|nr:hypothetical protein [Opitutus sp.]